MSSHYFIPPPPAFDGIPEELRHLTQWLVWKLELRQDKQGRDRWTKVPYNAGTGTQASTTDPSTWSTFADAVDAYKASAGHYGGIGFVLTLPLVGVDLDDCRDPLSGTLTPEAEAIVREFDSYTEVSPSGTGVKIFARGVLPGSGRKCGPIEMYTTARYFTCTGQRVAGTNAEIRNAQPAVDHLLSTVFAGAAVRPAAPPAACCPLGACGASVTLDPVLRDIIDRAMAATNGGKFQALFAGDFSAYPSQSEADLALCSMLGFWTSNDVVLMDGLFRASGLMRPKWDEQHGQFTYGEMTIAAACGNSTRATPTTKSSSPRVSTPHMAVAPPAPFPLDALPGVLRDFIREAAEALPCPPDFVGVPLLSVLGAAIGAGRVLEVKPGWREAPRLWTAVIASPGTKKSPALRQAVAPLDDIQSKMDGQHRKAHADYRDLKARWEVDHRMWQTALRKNPGAARARPVEPTEPVPTQVFCTDVTIEALATLLEQNPRGVLFLRDELTAWVRAMDQYRGGKGADRQHWLSLWSGAPVAINRKGSAPVRLASPFVAVTGCLPPELLSELADRQNREDGFLHRVLCAYPAPTAPRWSDATVDPATVASTCRLVERLFNENAYTATPAIAVFTPTAMDTFRDWLKRHMGELSAPDFAPSLSGPWLKLEAYCARLALIVHEARWAAGETVDRDRVDSTSVESAILLIEYFKTHTHRVYAEVVTSSTDRRIHAALAWITRQPQKTTTARDLLRAKVAGVATARDASQLLDELEARGHGTVTRLPRHSVTFVMN